MENQLRGVRWEDKLLGARVVNTSVGVHPAHVLRPGMKLDLKAIDWFIQQSNTVFRLGLEKQLKLREQHFCEKLPAVPSVFLRVSTEADAAVLQGSQGTSCASSRTGQCSKRGPRALVVKP